MNSRDQARVPKDSSYMVDNRLGGGRGFDTFFKWQSLRGYGDAGRLQSAGQGSGENEGERHQGRYPYPLARLAPAALPCMHSRL